MDKPELLRRLKIACHRGNIDFDDAIERCRTGQAQFFENDEAAAITNIVVANGARVLDILVMAGSLDGLKDLFSVLKQFGEDQACDEVQVIGRKGFERLFRSMTKEIGMVEPIATVYRMRF